MRGRVEAPQNAFPWYTAFEAPLETPPVFPRLGTITFDCELMSVTAGLAQCHILFPFDILGAHLLSLSLTEVQQVIRTPSDAARV
jgi:hypothetical protein